jgi:hypothetical protein
MAESIMPKILELRAKSLVNALEKAQQWMTSNSPAEICWSRGVKDSTLSLLPGAYWRKGYNEKTAEPLAKSSKARNLCGGDSRL